MQGKDCICKNNIVCVLPSFVSSKVHFGLSSLGSTITSFIGSNRDRIIKLCQEKGKMLVWNPILHSPAYHTCLMLEAFDGTFSLPLFSELNNWFFSCEKWNKRSMSKSSP